MLIADFSHEHFQARKILKSTHIQLLMYLYTWILSDKPPKNYKIIDSKRFYLISYIYVANELGMELRSVQNYVRRLRGMDGKSEETYLYSRIISNRVDNNQSYVAIDPDLALLALNPDSKANTNLIKNISRERKVPKLFDFDDVIEPSEKPKDDRRNLGFSPHAEEIVRDVISDNTDIFKTRLPNLKDKANYSKTYTKACRIVQDIYNGTFGSARSNNPNAVKLGDSKWFDTEGWCKKIKNVEGDYEKVRELITGAVENYRLMFRPEYSPFSKNSLPHSFEAWLYNEYSQGYDNPISYFVYSLKAPNKMIDQLSANKADRIYDELPPHACEGGNELWRQFMEAVKNPELLREGPFWENIRIMTEWEDWALGKDPLIFNWLKKKGQITEELADFCYDKDIPVNLHTVDVEHAFGCNGPFRWMLIQKAKEYGFDMSVIDYCPNKLKRR